MASIVRLPLPIDRHWDWQRWAACRGMDQSAFFHPPGERGAPLREREERAKEICAGCPVRERCLEHSLRVEEDYGTWGGLGERERRALILQRRRARRGPMTATESDAPGP